VLNLDPAKLLVIAVVAVILLGPDRLPQVARQVSGVWRTFNEYRHRMESEVRSSMPDLPSTAEIARLVRSPSALLDHLSSLSPDPDGTDGTLPPSPAADPPHGRASTFPAPSVGVPTPSRIPPVAAQPSSLAPGAGLPGDPGFN
jgi:sec-independent protein translocase protein TatB